VADDGRIVTGCNVENASYGVTLCAECTLVGQLRLTGGGRLVALACRSGDGQLLMPCGRCRQVLHEFGGDDLLVDTPVGAQQLGVLLPMAFTMQTAGTRPAGDKPAAFGEVR
jgi:cytidine deaminase